MRSYLIISSIIVFTVFGDYALKSASVKAIPFATSWFVVGAILYAATAFGWILLMQSHNLAQVAVLYSSVTILALTGVGYAFFNESISSRQLIGLSAALLSVFLMDAGA